MTDAEGFEQYKIKVAATKRQQEEKFAADRIGVQNTIESMYTNPNSAWNRPRKPEGFFAGISRGVNNFVDSAYDTITGAPTAKDREFNAEQLVSNREGLAAHAVAEEQKKITQHQLLSKNNYIN